MVMKKFAPSLQAMYGSLDAPVEKEPRGVMSAAFQRETLFASGFVTRTRRPSNAADKGEERPLPVGVWRTTPVEARTTTTESEEGTQMLVPSNTGYRLVAPMVTVWRIEPAVSTRSRAPRRLSEIQTLEPSYTGPYGRMKPTDTVVTVQGAAGPGVTIDMDPWFAVQIR